MRKVGNALRVLLLAALLLPAGPRALACSSCGSGGADPVILNPNEKQKFYLGLSHQDGIKDINPDGDAVKSYGPKVKESMDLAFAQRLHPKIFASAVVNFGRNVYGSDSAMQNGDITLNTRTTLLQQNIADPFIPQIQVMVGHRFAIARSIYDFRQDHMLDVFGAGYDETYVGADIWYGMSPVMFGGSVIFGFPEETDSPDGTIKPGRLQRMIATIGGMPWTEAKLIGGFIHEQRGGFQLDGADQDSSDRLSHDLFLTAETLYSEGSNYRLSLSRRAAFGENKTGVRVNVMTLAWMRPL